MKTKLVLKPFAVSILYVSFVAIVIVGLFYSINLVEEKENLTYVSKVILDEYVPVVATEEERIIKPYTGEEVTVLNTYYDYKDPSKQNSAIMFYENTYIQNTGINYYSDKKFEVVSILSGEILDVSDDNILGKTITIKHDNNIISVYGSVDNVKVKKGDKVLIGEVIATSSVSDILKENNNLHFELHVNGEVVNPLEYYDKSLKEI